MSSRMGNVTKGERSSGVICQCKGCVGCRYVGESIDENAPDKSSCRLYPSEKGMMKPDAVLYEGLRCPWYEPEGETKVKKRKGDLFPPVLFHNVTSAKVRIALVEILLHAYTVIRQEKSVVFESDFVDTMTAKRLAGVIFQWYGVLDAEIYEPVFTEMLESSWGPEFFKHPRRELTINGTLVELIQKMEPEEFEVVLKEILKPKDKEKREMFDMSFTGQL